MTAFRYHCLGIGTLVVTLLLAAAPNGFAAEMRRLSAAEIERTVIGNTLTGISKAAGCSFLDYYDFDGTAASRCGSHHDTGRWRILADQVCVDWTKMTDVYCIEIFSDGQHYAVRNPRVGNQLFPVILIRGERRHF